jgi:oxygen-independent coproporphyrinogen-3 oxidase
LAGIYIHIPFCKQACHYCNFHFSTSLRYKNELITALLKEMKLQRDYFVNERVETVYIGGGTPACAARMEISRILEKRIFKL